ncbi:MAG: acetyl-CoA C-acyltransferase [Deltaproteobacteria bacterium]|nr:acetyl-CoA C-acyltransferase [Deltaproteobacteria bacterium]
MPKSPGDAREIWILGAKRTAFGTFGGTLKDVKATDLGTAAATAAVAQSGVSPADFDQVIFGCVAQSTPEDVYCARHIGLRAGLPVEVPALTVNRLCGSGFQALIGGAQEIRAGDADICLVGGTESMSLAPHVVRGARWGLPLGKGAPLEDLLWSTLTDTYAGCSMGETAENVAERYGITRAAADAYALESQQRWAAADREGRFTDEIVGYDVKSKKGAGIFARDEHPRPQTTAEGLAKLASIFRPGGTVTAGTASGISDGAAALVIAARDVVEAKGLQSHALGRLVGWGLAGVDPKLMGMGPVPAIGHALQRAGLKVGDIDLFDVNEAFAPQVLAVMKELDLPPARTNVNGGAIALGHPLGASGARITGHLLYEMARRKVRLAVGAACIGGGQGIAVILESLL